MGMFDEIRVEVPLPDSNEIPHGKVFQTKDLENCLEQYIIASDKRLYVERWEYEETDSIDTKHSIFSLGLKRIPDSRQLIPLDDYHGDIRFYGDHTGTVSDETGVVYRDYIARFTDGILTKITYTDTRIDNKKSDASP
jgi:hypothetical protein